VNPLRERVRGRWNTIEGASAARGASTKLRAYSAGALDLTWRSRHAYEHVERPRAVHAVDAGDSMSDV